MTNRNSKLLDHSELDARQVARCQAFARLLEKVGSDMNKVLEQHGLNGMQIESFSFRERAKAVSGKPAYPTGIGLTADGVWVAA